MPAKRTTILRWTGRGKLDDLRSSVEFVMGEEGMKPRVYIIGDSITLDGPEPLGVAALLGWMPGVAWVAAGLTARSHKELYSAARRLAEKYLRRNDRFSVEAEGRGGAVASDVAGTVTSAALDGTKGSRVDQESPRVRFRAAFDGGRGVVGVEVKRGPGGFPMGREQVACFVSGGAHSSVVAWEALRQGFRVRLVHAKYSEESLKAVARLYSELSHRADPRGLSLVVLEGDSVSGALSGYADRSKERVFAGYAVAGGRRWLQKVLSPLYLMSEERFAEEFSALGIRSFDAPEDWTKKAAGEQVVRRFGGRRADVSGVLDGLR
jgi:adenylyl- and sulfurtransferase ThiI